VSDDRVRSPPKDEKGRVVWTAARVAGMNDDGISQSEPPRPHRLESVTSVYACRAAGEYL